MPSTTARNVRMKMPRAGSVANACTDTSTPERTRKVPSNDNANARIASSTVQALSWPRFSVTASEWINAVPTSHGMNEAFSTGRSEEHKSELQSLMRIQYAVFCLKKKKRNKVKEEKKQQNKVYKVKHK